MLAAFALVVVQSMPIAVAPFHNRCFDDAALAARVRANVDGNVAVGPAPRGTPHEEVRVVERADGLEVQVTTRDARGAVAGSSHRVVPADDCAAALDVTALIVARAALPLTTANPPPPPRKPHRPQHAHEPPPRESPTRESPPRESPTRESPPEGTQPPAQPSTPEQEPPSTEPAPPPPKTQVIVIEKPVERRVVVKEPLPAGAIILKTRGPEHRTVGELAVAVYGAFGLDGAGSDQPAGELTLGFRRGHFGAAVRGDVEGDHSIPASSDGTVALAFRRTQVALEAHADVGVRVGAIRFAAGPTMPLWIVRPSGVPGAHTSVLVSVGAAARLLYHLDLGRVFLTAGVTFDAAFVREQLTVTGIGAVARTPLFEVGPFLGFGVNL